MDIHIPTRIEIHCEECTEEKRLQGGIYKFSVVTFESLSLACMHIFETIKKNGIPHTLKIELED